MSGKRNIQVAELIAHAAGEFIARESNRESLITITRADVTPDLKHANLFMSVLPDRFEDVALLFMKRRTTDFRKYLIDNTRLGHLPHIDFLIDEGEKNRQRIDELTQGATAPRCRIHQNSASRIYGTEGQNLARFCRDSKLFHML